MQNRPSKFLQILFQSSKFQIYSIKAFSSTLIKTLKKNLKNIFQSLVEFF